MKLGPAVKSLLAETIKLLSNYVRSTFLPKIIGSRDDSTKPKGNDLAQPLSHPERD